MKKGFTLVELLAVITILGIIALIIVPAAETSNKKIKQKAYEEQKEALLISLQDYRTSHPEVFMVTDTVTISLQELKNQGYVDYDVKNPKTGKCLDNTMTFKIKRVNKKYDYYIGNKLFDSADLLDTDNNDCVPQS